MNDETRTHLTAEEITRFVQQTLTPDERVSVAAHLDGCERCRSEVVETGRVVRAPPSRSRWLYAVPALAAAAAVVFFAIPRSSSVANGTALRGADERIPRVAVVAPSNDAEISSESLTFIWRAAGEGAQYTLTVTGTTGRVVLGQPTVDTTLTLSVTSALERGQTFLWYVDAVLANGESATSGIHRFMTSP